MAVEFVSRKKSEKWKVRGAFKWGDGDWDKCYIVFQRFLPPSCGKGNPKLHWFTVKSTGGLSQHLPIMVNPAGTASS